MIEFYLPGARISHAPDFVKKENINDALAFYEMLEDYEPTPLIEEKRLAKELGLGAVYIKDESKRFNLNAFKSIGGLYAVYKVICKKANKKLSMSEISEYSKDMLFVTATDGNHGRSVAYSANRMGARSVIFMPKGTAASRVENVNKIPLARATVTDKNYDDTVKTAYEFSKENSAYFVQDTSFPGYTEIPGYINTGYCVMAREALLQAKDFTHVFLQAGVGSMAAAVAAYYDNYMQKKPISVAVEPTAAPAVLNSVKEGRILSVESADTIMAWLNCQTPSLICFPVLKDVFSAYAAIDDDAARTGMRVLKKAGIISGESGAATAGLLYTVMTSPVFAGMRKKLKLDKNAKVLLFSTEGDTDPVNYKKITEGY